MARPNSSAQRLPRLAGAILASVLVTGLMAPPAQAATTARLIASNSTTVKQGKPFRFVARIGNTAGTAQTIDVTFTLKSLDGSEPNVDFERWAGSVPAQGKIDVPIAVTTGQWFASKGRFKVLTKENGLYFGKGIRFDVVKAGVRPARFSDVTSAVGMAATRPDYLCGRWSGGGAWADIENDGDLDLFSPNQGGPPQLFVNNGGHFTDEATARGVAAGGQVGLGAVFADYDNDGDPDLYVAGFGADFLFQNDGTGRFVDVTAAAGVSDGLASQSAAWGDYDNDGDLDLYVANFAECLSQSVFNYHLDKLYRNEGDGTFSDQTALIENDPATTADGSTIGAGFQATWFDYDRDGDQDLYLGNDFLGNNPDANHMWRNDGMGADGEWQFTDVSSATGMGFKMHTMGAAVGDYDRDLDLDIALSNTSAKRLMQNDGRGVFRDVAEAAGVARPDATVNNKAITWGLLFSDLNLDGWEDLFVAGGSLKTNPDPQTDEVWLNNKKGGFDDLSALSTANDPAIGRGVASADYDRDGRVDFFVFNQDGMPKLWRNTTSKKNRHWIQIDTVGTTSNRDGCGAMVTLESANGKQLREVFCGSTGLSSGSDPTLHFGLAKAETITRLTVEWPSGKTQVVTNLKADQVIKVTEP